MTTTTLANKVSTAVISTFTALPQKYKPRTTEWVPLSGIVVETSGEGLKCVALGNEVIAIRAFNCFLLEECRRLSTREEYISPYIQRASSHHSQPFEIRPEARIYFYSSEAPCGDGSMELTMASQTDPTPWTLPLTPTPAVPDQKIHPTIHLRGRGYFSQLGAVRTKPGRADSPQTSSKSCSDKLSLRQAVSLLLTLTSYLISPTNAYICTLVLPSSEYSPSACSRAFGAEGRMKSLAGVEWEGGYSFRPFQIVTTDVEFEFSKRHAGTRSSNLSAVVVEGRGCEALIGGVLQGRKQFSGVLAGSILCKAKLWRDVVHIAPGEMSAANYVDLKQGASCRQAVKVDVREALGGWIKTGGDDFEIPSAMN